MTAPVAVLVLCAAVLHASWNALLKSGTDRFAAIVTMSLAASVVAAPALLGLPWPRPGAWWCVVLSAALHVGYNLFLVRSYRHGDLGQVYPVARGASPLLVVAGAALVAGEHPHPVTLLGVVMICAGILSLASGWGATAGRAGLGAALATGAFIAAYTVTDGIGGRLAGDPLSYAAWLFVVDGLPMGVIFVLVRGTPKALVRVPREAVRAAVGGVVSLLAYAAVIWAASISPMGAVSALRETSVVFAALIGRFALGEPLTGRRLASCAMVAGGAVLLGARG